MPSIELSSERLETLIEKYEERLRDALRWTAGSTVASAVLLWLWADVASQPISVTNSVSDSLLLFVLAQYLVVTSWTALGHRIQALGDTISLEWGLSTPSLSESRAMDLEGLKTKPKFLTRPTQVLDFLIIGVVVWLALYGSAAIDRALMWGIVAIEVALPLFAALSLFLLYPLDVRALKNQEFRAFMEKRIAARKAKAGETWERDRRQTVRVIVTMVSAAQLALLVAIIAPVIPLTPEAGRVLLLGVAFWVSAYFSGKLCWPMVKRLSDLVRGLDKALYESLDGTPIPVDSIKAMLGPSIRPPDRIL